LLSFAEQSLTSSLTGLLVATVPFAAVIAARVAGDDDRLTPIRLAGMVLGVIGIAALLGLDVRGAQLTAIGAAALVVLGYATAPMIASRALSDVAGRRRQLGRTVRDCGRLRAVRRRDWTR